MPDITVLKSYLFDSLAILRSSLVLSAGEQPAFYRVAALQLRLLLCDTTRRHGQRVDIALVPRVWPDFQLHPLGVAGIDLSLPPVALSTWLEQYLSISARRITIRQLIRRVCDQDGGAHVDPKLREGLPVSDDAREWILRLGGYVVPMIEARLMADSQWMEKSE